MKRAEDEAAENVAGGGAGRAQSSDRREELRRKLQRFNERYGVPVVSRRIEPDATRSSTGSRKLDSQAALAQAQQEKAEAEAELSALTDKLASDAKRRPGRGLERYEVDEIKRRCSRLRQILGEVKRREKDLALKQQFNQEQKQRVAEVGIPPCPLSRAPPRALWLFLVSVTCRRDT